MLEIALYALLCLSCFVFIVWRWTTDFDGITIIGLITFSVISVVPVLNIGFAIAAFIIWMMEVSSKISLHKYFRKKR